MSEQRPDNTAGSTAERPRVGVLGYPVRAVRWIFAQEIVVLLSALVVVAGCWGFAELADEVGEGETQKFDEWAVRLLRHKDPPHDLLGPEWLASAGRDITGLGSVIVLVLVTLAVVGFLWLRRLRHAMWFVLVATIGGMILSQILKGIFDRPRPDIVPHADKVLTSSFPSGHSMLSAVVYLTLGALLTRLVDGRWLKIYILAVAMVATGLVGISRVYMGVHYPTDVLAGWTMGLVWSLACWAVARVLQKRGAVEEPVHEREIDR